MIANAKAFLAVRDEAASLDAYGRRYRDPAALSRDLSARGFRFVGPTIFESFMGATGILDHHLRNCFRW